MFYFTQNTGFHNIIPSDFGIVTVIIFPSTMQYIRFYPGALSRATAVKIEIFIAVCLYRTAYNILVGRNGSNETEFYDRFRLPVARDARRRRIK